MASISQLDSEIALLYDRREKLQQEEKETSVKQRLEGCEKEEMFVLYKVHDTYYKSRTAAQVFCDEYNKSWMNHNDSDWPHPERMRFSLEDAIHIASKIVG